MTERTPTPWATLNGDLIVSGEDDTVVCRVPNHPDNGANWTANAAFIVKAVNNHDLLIKAMEAAKRLIGAINDTAPPTVKESNINMAWHILDGSLRAISAPVEPPVTSSK
jgi:hypothetical protein